MKNIFLPILLLFLISAGIVYASTMTKTSTESVKMENKNTDALWYRKAYFAAGCFWSAESSFEKHLGIIEVVSGYAGGKEVNPTYKEVSSGRTGHREAVEVTYDPKLISYADLLRIFYRTVDPTDAGGQFVDRWFHYTSAIFYRDAWEKKIALASKALLEKSGQYSAPIVTTILPYTTFFRAEDSHQDFYKTHKEYYERYRSGSGRDAYLKKIWWGDLDFKLKPKKEDAASLKKRLTPLQYAVTQESGTEQPYKNAFWHNHEKGIYVDVVDGTPLFSSLDKFDSGTGWPSFVKPIDIGLVIEKTDNELFGVRTEVRSTQADSHLGHVFTDGPKDRGGLRYCINSASLRFVSVADLEKEGYGEYAKMFQ